MHLFLFFGSTSVLDSKHHSNSLYSITHIQEHNKKYKDEATELLCFSIWKENLALIQHHNEHADKGFTLAMNIFGDLTNEEFNKIYNGFKMEEGEKKKKKNISEERSLFVASPDFMPSNATVAVDWRKQGVVTAVMNQGDCGSCWAFSATGSLEGQHKLNGKLLVSLSEQNLMDCSTLYHNMACLGGTMDEAFQYIIDNHGVDTEASYPYLAQTETKCRYNATNVGATMSSFVDIPISEPALTEASFKIGPISVAIDAGLASFRFYKSGVYYEPQCFTTRLNHGVLLIGYGTDEDGKEYYLVKNSWGTTWGMEGYIKMSRNRNNNCGIATVASYPVV